MMKSSLTKMKSKPSAQIMCMNTDMTRAHLRSHLAGAGGRRSGLGILAPMRLSWLYEVSSVVLARPA